MKSHDDPEENTSPADELAGVDNAAAAWLRELIATTQDAVVTIDRSSRVVLFNRSAERIFGYSWEEIRGQDVSVLMSQPYAHEHQGYIDRYEDTGEPRAIGRIRLVRARRKSGEEFPIELSVTKVSVNGEPRYGAFIRDVSEQKRLESKLLERERLATVGTTAAKFAHEVANPLNGMYTQAQLIRRRMFAGGAEPDPRLVDSMDLMIRDIDRLHQLLAEFRSMSRRSEYGFSSTDITDLWDEIVHANGPQWGEGGVRLESDVTDDARVLRADAGKLKQVFLNLAKNACDAMPEGGRIRLRGSREGDMVRYDVEDTGVGVDPNLDVFAAFATSKETGTGLGLPVVRQIVQAHGGRVTFESSDAGTVFSVMLPVDGPSGSAEAKEAAP